MAWVNLSAAFSFGSVLTSTQMQNLRDNIAAAFAKASGAPELAASYVVTGMLAASSVTAAKISANTVTQSEVGASAIGQGELKTTTADNTTTTTSVDVTLTGGDYAFLITGKTTAAVRPTTVYGDTTGNSTKIITTSLTNIIRIGVTTGGATATIRHRYIQASPPYDLGDGQISEFIFLAIDNTTGKIIHGSVGKDAPWHNNGPTRILPDYTDKKGIGYIRTRDIMAMPLTLRESETDLIKIKEYIQAYQSMPYVNIEITQEIKNKDMNLFPTPWPEDNPDIVKVMLNPVSNLTEQLSIMRDDPEFNLLELFHNNYFVIDNTSSGLNGPPGILVPNYKWKLTP